jgi:hypothetical protein
VSLGKQSVEQVGLLAHDALPKGLALDPADRGRTIHRASRSGVVGVDLEWLANRFGEKLRLTAPLHRDEPPHCLVDRLADGKEAVIAQYHRLRRPQRFGKMGAFDRFGDQYLRVVKKNVVLEEGAGVLRDGIEQPTDRRPRLAVERVAMRRSDDFRSR